eukprot:TRINITY_DN429_c5_g1_i1.p1 TRINITY_DN429_c5_g1~~TRINITY_DN429_c5_g1_i1.p1  ORF type:complete len:932 (+),score=196.77 TRINITY_DN429_c5_g1_i1:67-2862(+)
MNGGWISKTEGDGLMSLRSHVTWLYDVVLREMIPDGETDELFVDEMCKACKALDTHKGDNRSLFSKNPDIIRLLSDGRWYAYACWVVFSDIPRTLATMLTEGPKIDPKQMQLQLLTWFTTSHNLVLDVDVEQAADELSRTGNEFSPYLHNYILDFLIFEYCCTFVEVSDIEEHLNSFVEAPTTTGDTLETALLNWLKHVSALFCKTSDVPLLSHSSSASFHEAVVDGRLLAVTFFKYDTLFLKSQDLHLSADITVEEQISNWEHVLNACKRSKVTAPFTAQEVVKHGTGCLRWQLLWLVQMCYVVLKKSCEGVLGGCPFTELIPGEMEQVTTQEVTPKSSNYRYANDLSGTTMSVASFFLGESISTCVPLKRTAEEVTVTISRTTPSDRLHFHISLNLSDEPYITAVDDNSDNELSPGMLITHIDGVEMSTCLDVLQAITNKNQFVVHAKATISSVSIVGASMQMLSKKIEDKDDDDALSSVEDEDDVPPQNLLTFRTVEEFNGRWSTSLRHAEEDGSSSSSSDYQNNGEMSATSIVVEDLSILDAPPPLVRDSIKSLAALKRGSSSATSTSPMATVTTVVSDPSDFFEEVQSLDTVINEGMSSQRSSPSMISVAPVSVVTMGSSGQVTECESESVGIHNTPTRPQQLSPLEAPLPTEEAIASIAAAPCEGLCASPTRPQQLSPLVGPIGNSTGGFAAVPLSGPDCLRDLKKGLSKRRLTKPSITEDQRDDDSIDLYRGRSSKRIAGARPVTNSCEKHIQIMKQDELISHSVEVTAAAKGRGRAILEKIEQRQRGLSKQRSSKLLPQRGNRKQITNAIKHVCLPGRINTQSQRSALQSLEEHDTGDSRFIILLKSQQQPLLRSLYICCGDQIKRIHGTGPRSLNSSSVTCLRYDCGTKMFAQLPKSFDVSDNRVEAVVVKASRSSSQVQAP